MTPELEDLRRLAALHGLRPGDDDLESVRAFLAVLLPAIEELERSLPADAPPAGIPLP
jgi:hypothetical protein